MFKCTREVKARKPKGCLLFDRAFMHSIGVYSRKHLKLGTGNQQTAR